MPAALLKGCATVGCPELVEQGHCPTHTRAFEQRRGSAASRGYGTQWRAFKVWFINQLIARGITPVCGAALPEGPSVGDSQCKAAGRLNGSHLHLDHDPPLRPDERLNHRAVGDPRRVGLLCEACHNRKTQREQQQGART